MKPDCKRIVAAVGLMFFCGCSTRSALPVSQSALSSGAAAKILQCGEIEARAPVRTTEAPDTELGYVNVMHELEKPVFKSGCPHVSAAMGTRFGIELLVEGAKGQSIVPLTTRVTHPEMKHPGTGGVVTVDSWASPMNSGIPRYTGWKFDNRWELVPGKWTFDILDGEKVIATQEFEVSVEP